VAVGCGESHEFAAWISITNILYGGHV
jgi:hypothetical protein